MYNNKLLTTLIVLAFSFSQSLLAQTSDVKILVMDLAGIIEYNAPGVKAGPLAIATLVSLEGSVKLEEGSRVTLLANGMPYEINTKGKYRLSEVVDKNLEMPRGFSFDGVFFSRLLSAVGVEPDVNAAQAVLQSPANASRVASTDIRFTDLSLKSSGTYTFRLYDKALDSLLLSESVATPELTLDFAELGLAEDREYCYAFEGDAQTCFTYTGVNGLRGLIRLIETSSKAYPESSDLLQALMRAVAFERGGFSYDAAKLYDEWLEMHPDHKAIQLLKASIAR